MGLRPRWRLAAADGIARDVRRLTVAGWDEARMFDCLAWLYDGAPHALIQSNRMGAKTLDGPPNLDSIGSQTNQAG